MSWSGRCLGGGDNWCAAGGMAAAFYLNASSCTFFCRKREKFSSRLLCQEVPCVKGGKKRPSRAEMTTSLIDNIIGNEDIAFHISSFLCPQRNPATLTEFYANECFVAKLWNNAFGLVRAQLRWDFLRTQLKNDEVNGWLYHKLMYIPKGVSVPIGGGGKDKLIPHEGIIRIFRSHVNGKMAFRYFLLFTIQPSQLSLSSKIRVSRALKTIDQIVRTTKHIGNTIEPIHGLTITTELIERFRSA